MLRGWALISLIVAMASGAFAQVSSNGASAVEQALIEHACRSQVPGIAGADAYQECLTTHLRALRADHGRDLSQLSAADRNTLDSACSAKRTAEGREAYLECLTVQLVSIHNRDNPTAAASQEIAVAPRSENTQSSVLVPRGSANSWLS